MKGLILKGLCLLLWVSHKPRVFMVCFAICVLEQGLVNFVPEVPGSK